MIRREFTWDTLVDNFLALYEGAEKAAERMEAVLDLHFTDGTNHCAECKEYSDKGQRCETVRLLTGNTGEATE